MQHDLPMKAAMAPVSDDVVARQPSMTGALILCQTLSGLEDKQLVGFNGIGHPKHHTAVLVKLNKIGYFHSVIKGCKGKQLLTSGTVNNS